MQEKPNAPLATSDSVEFVSVAESISLPPGHGRTVQVKGREFAIYNVDGRFYAIDNTCPHRSGPLGAGWLENGVVFCPLHGWSFDVKTGASLSNPAKAVRSYPARVLAGQVQIGLPADGNLS